MLFDQYQWQEVCQTPEIFNDVVDPLSSDIKSPDFILADSISTNLSLFQSKENVCELINDSNNFHSQYQQDLFDIDINEILGDDILNDIDIQELISSVSFPCPSESSSSMTIEGNQMATDMIVPASSPTSSISSAASGSSFKRSKLSPIERKLRKKNQNKTAAEKYRVKKKSERDQLADRHASLKSSNKELKSQLEALTSRVQQLKQLLIDVVQVDLTL